MTVHSGSPRVAVIGGGIFGTTCAIVMGESCSVTLFERHDDILAEASRANQYRHHLGYHYPRSPETIREIQRARRGFEALYQEAIVDDFPSYYAVAREGSKTTPEVFQKLCQDFDLPYEEAYPDPQLLDRSMVSWCIKTPEPMYDYERLKHLVRDLIHQNPNIQLKLNHRVVGAQLNAEGEKILSYENGAGQRNESFEYVIHVTYANYNELCAWLDLPRRALECRLKEIVVVELPPAPRVAVTVVDGPFTTLVPLGRTPRYTLGDVALSIHERVTMQGDELLLGERWKRIRTRWAEMQPRCAQWIPILRRARYVESMYVVLPLEPASEMTDARPTDITAHGHGCWSILSGKIITAVSTAQAMRDAILAEVRV